MDPCEFTYERREGTAQGYEGQSYEFHILGWYLLQGIIKKLKGQIESFFLASNMLEGEDLDDVVFKYSFKDNNNILQDKVIFLQCKQTNNVKPIHINDIWIELHKYFICYLKIKQCFSQAVNHEIFGINNWFDNCELIFFTNKTIDENSTKQYARKKMTNKKDFLHLGGNYYYELYDNDEIIEKIKSNSAFNQLVEALASLLLNSIEKTDKPINWTLINKYHDILVKTMIKKIDTETGKLRSNFFADKNLRPAILKKISEKIGKSPDEVENELNKLDIKLSGKFVQSKNGKKSLPNELVYYEEDIKDFIKIFKLYYDQPGLEELEDKMQQQIKVEFNLNPSVIDAIYSYYIKQVEKYWMNKSKYVPYLTEKNMFLENALKVYKKCSVTMNDYQNTIDEITNDEYGELAKKNFYCSVYLPRYINTNILLPLVQNENELNMALHLLKQDSMINYDENQRQFTVSKLYQGITIEILKEQGEDKVYEKISQNLRSRRFSENVPRSSRGLAWRRG